MNKNNYFGDGMSKIIGSGEGVADILDRLHCRIVLVMSLHFFLLLRI